MRRVLGLLPFYLFTFLPLSAQPGWVKKATKSVFTVKTFSADGSLIGSSNGFFTGTDGEAVSNFTPFKGASRAVIIDAAGKEMPVSAIMGANDMYDVVKFRVAASKTQPLTIATEIAPTGSTVWLLPYRETKVIKSGAVRKAETFQVEYAYYTVAMQTPETAVSCPLLNEAGEVVGLMQQPASAADSLSYAVSARFADSLKVTGFSLNDPTLKLTAIKKELPQTLEETNLLIYLAGSTVDSATYVGLVDEMIEKFPDAPDGYVYRAEIAANTANYAAAEKDMQQALKVADVKDEVLFSYARMIYNKEIYQNLQPFEPWSLDKALAQIQEANGINPQPGYRQLEGNILFAQKKYDDAYNIFIELTDTNLDKAEMWYGAARCKEMQKDTIAMLALLDSAVCTFSKPYLKQAAPYLWTRGNKRFDCGKYRDAVADFNEYEQLMAAQVNARFYYIRGAPLPAGTQRHQSRHPNGTQGVALPRREGCTPDTRRTICGCHHDGGGTHRPRARRQQRLPVQGPRPVSDGQEERGLGVAPEGQGHGRPASRHPHREIQIKQEIPAGLGGDFLCS